MTEPNLISSVILQGREYLVKMNVLNKYLELLISDKQSGEEWQCSYDHSYIENLTHKTGNFKQFETFIAMIKSGLLKTSDCISLELLTFEDLDSLRTKKIRGHSRHFSNSHGNNKRYLIVTYNVEFDRIHYPLPLEYCGPPDPIVLQATIRKLESELVKLKEEHHLRGSNSNSKQIIALQRRIEDLMAENLTLRNEIHDLHLIVDNAPRGQVKVLEKAIVNLERSVLTERKSHHILVEKLKNEKIKLVRELERAKSSEKALKVQVNQLSKTKFIRKPDYKSPLLNRSDQTLETLYRRNSPITKARSEGNKILRARSMSPRIAKSEGYRRHSEVPSLHFPKSSSRHRSRSSSLSSSRNYPSNDFHALETEPIEEKCIRSTKRSSIKQTKFVRSRSSSADSSRSHYSGMSDDLGAKSSRSIKTRLQNSKKEFQSLENRIHALQSILKENLKLNDF